MNITLWDAAKQMQLKSRAKTKLSLPAVIIMSDIGRQGSIQEWAATIPQGTLVILRDYELENRDEYIRQTAKILHQRNIPFLVAANVELAKEVDAAGVHCPQWFTPKNAPYDMLLFASIHNQQELEQREQDPLSYTAYIVSPIFQTASHPDITPLKPDALNLLQNTTTTPLYALGGINAETINQLENMSFYGIAGTGLATK